MGPLKLPDSGSIYVDSQILIYSIEKHPVYAPMLRSFWAAVEARRLEAHCSELVFLETLVLPIRNGDKQLILDYEAVFDSGMLQIHPISKEVLLEAAHLRAAFSAIRTPDAIHAPTAHMLGCNVILTNDAALRHVGGIDLLLLSDNV